MSASTQSVFFDPTGRRWRRVRIAALVVVVMAALAGGWSWEAVHVPPPLGPDARPAPLPATTGPDPPPVIGAGPLVRLVGIDSAAGRPVAVDPFTGAPVGAIPNEQAHTVRNRPFAIQRYGYGDSVHRTIALTFDDGPDQTWTPKILDLLSRNRVPATFFVLGTHAIRHPELVARAAREGHTVANHTMTHSPVTVANARDEIVRADRVLTAITNSRTTLFRLPYVGKGERSTDGGRVGIAAAQRLGYLVSEPDFDTNDWQYGDPANRPRGAIPLPPANADNITILLHDGGGDRSTTLQYLDRLIPWARANGYSFHSLPQVSPDVAAGTRPERASWWDHETFLTYRVLMLGPNWLIHLLFMLAVAYVVVGGMVNLLLATGRRARSRRRLPSWPRDRLGPPVSIVVPAYNEERIIARTLRALCDTTYLNLLEIIVVDDGSSDRTSDVVAGVAGRHPRIRLLRQANSGKAIALNRGFMQARADVVVTLDADTLFTPATIGRLARHFALDRRGRLAAVAGTVKVGNLRNLLTRWQALEYVTLIGLERGAQDALRAMMVVPGACAAWRRDAVLRVGGYSPATLAEDCDLALELQRHGLLVIQDDTAAGYTEAPETFRALARQRLRWMYGNIQAIWKHRSMVLNPKYGWLGLLTLPSAVISILLPVLFLPFVYLMAALAIAGGSGELVVIYALLLMVVQLAQSTAGVWLLRERPVHLLVVPVYRLIFEPLRAYLLYRSAFTVLRGTRSGWHKLQRTGTVSVPATDRSGAR